MEPDRPDSKVCDAADFFTGEFIHTVNQELCEAPRMHRKQWEFAMIYLSLMRRGMLDGGKAGLSMGSGRERLLYAIARRAGHLTATDLYSSASLWDCAQASDPDDYIRKSKPFPVDDSRLSALHMDMRKLEFDDGSFDFAYSSCALEHIGQDEDFLQHLHEVHRVLKDGGVYVFTTEFTFDPETIPIKNNYLFSADHLNRIIDASRFSAEMHCDARITEQSTNFPLPGQVEDLAFAGSGHFLGSLFEFGVIPHVQLLQGKHAFTSCLLVLRKGADQAKKKIVFNGLDASRAFMQACLRDYRGMISRELTLNPFSYLPGRTSAYYAPHVAAGKSGPGTSNTIFHTNYYWLGMGLRKIQITLDRERGHEEACRVELRAHRYRTLDPAAVECCFHEAVALPQVPGIEKEIAISVEDDYVYAVLAVMQTGSCQFSDIHVRVSSAVQAVTSTGTALPTPAPGRGSLLGTIWARAAGLTPERIKQLYRSLRHLVSS
jgi:SAM-dependent methyltransferase